VGGCCPIAIPNIFPFILNVMMIFIFLPKDACLDVLCITLTGLRSLFWFLFIAEQDIKQDTKSACFVIGDQKQSQSRACGLLHN